jgi:hypothetical protein
MPILAVNGGGNTPNGEAAEDRNEGAYVLTGVEHTAREDEAYTFSFDESTATDAETRLETRNSDLAFWGDIHNEETAATLTSDQGSTQWRWLAMTDGAVSPTAAAASNGTEVWTLISSGPLDL